MMEEGVSIPRYQKEEMLSLLSRILQRYRPQQIVINGDLKHEFSRNLGQEWDEVNEILDYLSSSAEITVVRGNHDNYLKTILAKKGIELFDAYEVEGVLFVHGHKIVSSHAKIRLKVIGHEHPSVLLRDEMGAQIKLPCYIYHRKESILVLPAFSPLASGTNIVSEWVEYLSPMLRDVDMSEAELYTVSELGVKYAGTPAHLFKYDAEML